MTDRPDWRLVLQADHIERLEEENAKLKAKNDELKKELEIFTRQLEKANKEVIKGKEKNATQRQKNEKLEQTLDEIKEFYQNELDQLKAELQKYKDMEAKGLEEFKDIGGCWGCGIQLTLDEVVKEFQQYKASKQASYEALQKRWNDVELENRKLKTDNEELKKRNL